MTAAQARLYHSGSASWTVRLGAMLGWPKRRARKRLLDARDLSDHLKRDVGFLDGNDPSGRRL